MSDSSIWDSSHVSNGLERSGCFGTENDARVEDEDRGLPVESSECVWEWRASRVGEVAVVLPAGKVNRRDLNSGV